MVVVLQRVAEARVEVRDELVGAIGRGLVALVGIARDDGEAEVEWMARKVADLRIFEDADGKMNLSARDVGGAVLAVSQFTLLADCNKGRRPNFTRAAPPEKARPLFEQFVAYLRGEGLRVATGRFGEHMHVHLVNDGPVTIVLERSSTSGTQ